MRIGILTVPFNNNYGGFLQAYALKQVFSGLGFDVIFINRKRDKKLIYDFIKRLIKKCICPNKVVLLQSKQQKQISINTNEFVKQYLTPQTKPYYNSNKIKKDIKNYNIDYYVVGSDQVWRYLYAQDSISDYFFDFIDTTKQPCFSYAASFGVDNNEYPPEYLQKCSLLLRNFIAISVREISAVNILRDYFNIEKPVSVVLDPTLLINEEHYLKLMKIRNFKLPDQDYILCYILDENESKRQFISYVESQLNLNSIYFHAQTSSCTQPVRPVEEWLFYIKNARYVLTDSFHGCVFSIIFKKPFYVYGNDNRGKARFDSLLNIFSLHDRYFDDTTSLNELNLTAGIDWNHVNKVLEVGRAKSMDFIVNALASVQNFRI